MKKTIGILAHVDAGKTTFSEQILYHTNAIRTRGRVDHKDAFLDSHSIEKERGITIFSDQAVFQYHDSTYYLVDTPGHVDFSAEMERTLRVLDYAVILVSCVEGVQGHTETLWRLLRKYGVPTLFFWNKTDRDGADVNRVMDEIKNKFSPNACNFTMEFHHGNMDETLIETVAQLKEQLLEQYLEWGYDQALWLSTVKQLVKDGELFPCFCGSALLDCGIDDFLQDLDLLSFTQYECTEKSDFAGHVYKIRHDYQGNRLVFLKVISGCLKVKNEIAFHPKDGDEPAFEKVNEIRIYNGSKYTCMNEVKAGDLCAVTGLSQVCPGDGVGSRLYHKDCETTPMLMSKVLFDNTLPAKTVLNVFKILEDEDPMLHVDWNEVLQEIHVSIMGAIQLEVLKELVQERFQMTVNFGKCEILYKETIQAPVIGYGHYEPLKHYAEVHLRLTPGIRGSGITFQSECSTDRLEANYQNLIRTHVFEKEQLGVLTGSPGTDIRVTLLTGRAHLKHTEGGDFREATYRAFRQGLRQAESILLEPYYCFQIEVQLDCMGRVLSDIQKMFGTFTTPELLQNTAVIRGRAPVATFMNYNQQLISFTKGKCSMNFIFDGYEPCHNADEVIAQKAYNADRDTENTADSVFCSHGAGFNVKWDEAQSHMHCHL